MRSSTANLFIRIPAVCSNRLTHPRVTHSVSHPSTSHRYLRPHPPSPSTVHRVRKHYSTRDPDVSRTNWHQSALKYQRIALERANKLLSAAGLKLNEVTGYKEVERLKAVVTEKEQRLRQLRADAKIAKHEYEEAVSQRATTQSEVNRLLERKHAWGDSDVSRFTTLVRSDHSSNQQVAASTVKLKEIELETDRAFSDLMQAILQRYHEEQVWSDKIRNTSTYAGALGLAINLVVFVGAIAFVEPWKRRRLVERLEEKMLGMAGKMDASVLRLEEKLDSVSAHHDTRSLQLPNSPTDGPTPLTLPISPATTPRWQRSLDWLPEELRILAVPSSDRDLIASSVCGLAAGVTLAVSFLWIFCR